MPSVKRRNGTGKSWKGKSEIGGERMTNDFIRLNGKAVYDNP